MKMRRVKYGIKMESLMKNTHLIMDMDEFQHQLSVVHSSNIAEYTIYVRQNPVLIHSKYNAGQNTLGLEAIISNSMCTISKDKYMC